MPASAQTVSVSRGKTAIEHDLREYTPNNVDPSMSIYNAVLINELGGKSLAEYTNEYMKGVTFKTPIFVRFFKTFFKKLKVCSVAQKRPSLGRHFESLKKRLFMKLFYFR